MRIALTKYLNLDEYIPKELYLKYEKAPHKLIGMLDKRLIDSDHLLRIEFGPVIINNWWNGNGDRNWSGIRTPGSPYYSFTSQHPWGRASDKIFIESKPHIVNKYIEENWIELGITAIEKQATWNHTDTRWYRGNKLLIFKPKKT